MAGATAAPVLRYSVPSIKPSNRIISSFSRSANLSFKHQISRIHRLKSQTPNSRSSIITTCHGTVFDEFFDDDESREEDEETESSLDLLFRFLESMFKKISNRAKKDARSLLPVAMSPQLLSFAVDGGLLLASLSILKAFLEMCTKLTKTTQIIRLDRPIEKVSRKIQTKEKVMRQIARQGWINKVQRDVHLSHQS